MKIFTMLVAAVVFAVGCQELKPPSVGGSGIEVGGDDAAGLVEVDATDVAEADAGTDASHDTLDTKDAADAAEIADEVSETVDAEDSADSPDAPDVAEVPDEADAEEIEEADAGVDAVDSVDAADAAEIADEVSETVDAEDSADSPDAPDVAEVPDEADAEEIEEADAGDDAVDTLDAVGTIDTAEPEPDFGGVYDETPSPDTSPDVGYPIGLPVCVTSSAGEAYTHCMVPCVSNSDCKNGLVPEWGQCVTIKQPDGSNKYIFTTAYVVEKCSAVGEFGPECQLDYVLHGCDDQSACTDDSCDQIKGCVHASNTASCDDGNLCTTADACVGGKCVGGVAPSCEDQNACTTDACQLPVGCTHTDINCDDSNVCTLDSCDTTSGCKHELISCDDANICTDDLCDSVQGCVHAPNTAPCDDTNPCTLADACANGKCVGGSANPCEDQNACTTDACQLPVGCTHTDISCDDANACTDDDCAPKNGCVHFPNTLTCNDGNACSTGDQCNAGTCKGSDLVCDDTNQCTADSCDSATGCVFKPLGPVLEFTFESGSGPLSSEWTVGNIGGGTEQWAVVCGEGLFGLCSMQTEVPVGTTHTASFILPTITADAELRWYWWRYGYELEVVLTADIEGGAAKELDRWKYSKIVPDSLVLTPADSGKKVTFTVLGKKPASYGYSFVRVDNIQLWMPTICAPPKPVPPK